MRITILGSRGDSTNAVINAVSERYDAVTAIIEDDVPLKEFLGRRIRKLGLRTVMGQMAFAAIVPKILRKKSGRRIEQIKEHYHLKTDEEYKDRIDCRFVTSINDSQAEDAIIQSEPDIIIVNGTRIISKSLIERMHVPMINMHMGITPKYRGVHGGYWAVVNHDMENCGVTIHMVDEGIDTGNVICQKRIPVRPRDNYITYPYLQAGVGIRAELKVLEKFEKTGRIDTYEVDLPSMLWTHPTLWQYMRNRKNNRRLS